MRGGAGWNAMPGRAAAGLWKMGYKKWTWWQKDNQSYKYQRATQKVAVVVILPPVEVGGNPA
jgi:hypothetical protein